MGPRSRGRLITVQADLRKPECVQSVQLRFTQERKPARLYQQMPDAHARIVYEGRLPTGHYRLAVRLRCEDARDVDALSRPLEVEADDVQVPLTITSSCGCAS